MMTRSSEGGVSRRKFLISSGVASAFALAGCAENTTGNGGDNTDDGLSGEVVVKGSSTVFPVSDAMAEEFIKDHGEVNVTVDATGTGGGFKNWFCTGKSDINGASRQIKDSEEQDCSDNDITPIEFQIGGDALTVAVNKNADWVDCMTPEELSQIWRDDGVSKWSDVRDEWPDKQFQLFGPASTSGTFDWFSSNIIGEEYQHTDEHQPTEEDSAIVQGIKDNKHGMGYFGYAYYKENSDQVKAVEIDGGDGCTEPSLANAKDGSYPMARPLYIYVAESALQEEEVYEFVKFYLEQSETDMIQEIGYVPASEDLRDENLQKLEDVAGN